MSSWDALTFVCLICALVIVTWEPGVYGWVQVAS